MQKMTFNPESASAIETATIGALKDYPTALAAVMNARGALSEMAAAQKADPTKVRSADVADSEVAGMEAAGWEVAA